MKLKKLSHHVVLATRNEDFEVPGQIEILDDQGTTRARYDWTIDHVGCMKFIGNYKDRYPDVVEVEDLPDKLRVEEAVLPDRFGVEIQFGEPCPKHGWDCSLWVKEAIYQRSSDEMDQADGAC